jgi:hypothetical protein
VIARRAARADLRSKVGYHDLVADLKRRGCPVCHGTVRSVWRYLDGLLWESVNDPGVRKDLRASHGFCREHWLLALRVASQQSAASGIAILADDLLRHVLADAERAVSADRSTRRRGRPLAPDAPCPGCVVSDRTAAAYLELLAVAEEGSEPFDGIRRAGRGLCARHLADGFALVHGAAGRERLLGAFTHGAEELRRELQEFGRKHDYRFRSEGFTEAESTSWTRAVHRLAGEASPRKEPPR